MNNLAPRAARWADGPIWLQEKTSYIVERPFVGFLYVPNKKHIYRDSSEVFHTVPAGDVITVLQKELLTRLDDDDGLAEMCFRERLYAIISWQEKFLCAYDYAYVSPLPPNE